MLKIYPLLLMALLFTGISVTANPTPDSMKKNMSENACCQASPIAAADCNTPAYYQQMPGHKILDRRHAKKMMCAMLMFMAIINILLTILVTQDMMKTKRFNGLWLPLLLMAGIPVTALYALFRIGDNVKLGEENK